MHRLIRRIESLGMHRNFSYRIALHYVLEENFHPLKTHVTIPLIFLYKLYLKKKILLLPNPVRFLTGHDVLILRFFYSYDLRILRIKHALKVSGLFSTIFCFKISLSAWTHHAPLGSPNTFALIFLLFISTRLGEVPRPSIPARWRCRSVSSPSIPQRSETLGGWGRRSWAFDWLDNGVLFRLVEQAWVEKNPFYL